MIQISEALARFWKGVITPFCFAFLCSLKGVISISISRYYASLKGVITPFHFALLHLLERRYNAF